MAAASNPVRIAGTLFVAILVLIAALVFAGIYFALPSDHVAALLSIGVVSLVFALVADPGPVGDPKPRHAARARLGVRGARLRGTLRDHPRPGFSVTTEIIALILVLLALAVMVAGVWWMGRSQSADAPRMEARRDWDSRPPQSALSYSTAQGTPGVSPPTSAAPGGERR